MFELKSGEFIVRRKSHPVHVITRTTFILHLDLPSTCIHRDSPEGAAQREKEKLTQKKDGRRRSTMAEIFQEEEETERETRRKKVRHYRAKQGGGHLTFTSEEEQEECWRKAIRGREEKK